jgi:antibiotic biosynthesis monooxygenase
VRELEGKEKAVVLVQFRVRVPDVERFKTTQEKFVPVMEQLGGKNLRAYVSESDPNEVTTFSEWESHDAMMAATDKFGDDFNREAGTEGIEWETRIWHVL